MSKKKKASPAKKNVTQRTVDLKVLWPSFNQFFEKNAWAILVFCLALISFIVFKDFILLNKVYLYKDIGSDSINANYSHGYQVANYMQHESFIPKWSFYQGMGQNILPFSFSDPFYFILMLFGPENLAYGIGYMEVIKIFCAGVIFFLYLRKMNFSAYASIIGSLCYAFSGFAVLGSCWTIFTTETVYLALLLLAFERIYRDNSIWLMPITICLIAINQPFDIFLMSIFLFAYILFRFLDGNVFHFKKLFLLILKVAGLGVAGLLLSSFFFIPNVIQMLESPRVSGESAYFNKLISASIFSFESKFHYATAILRLFSNDTMGVGSDYKGWYNYLEAPLFYCGLINLLIVPQLVVFLSKRRKIVFISFIALFILPVIFPFLRYMFWGFTGDYYRLFSFFLPFTLLLYSVNVLSQIEKNGRINLLILGVSVAVLLLILFNNYDTGINETKRNAAAFFLIVYAALLYFFNVKKVVNVIKAITLGFVILELISFSNTTVNDRPVITGEEMKQKTGFNDYTVDAVNYLKTVDKSFYRIVKEYSSGPAIHSSINDAQVQKYFSTTSYTSFNQKNYIKFLGAAEIIDEKDETQTRWAPGVTQTPILHSFASVKYTLSKRAQPIVVDYNYDILTTIGDVKILKNRSPLPLGFTYSKFITKNDYNLLSGNQKKLILNKAFVLDDSIYKMLPGLSRSQLSDTSINYTWAEFGNDINLLKQDTLQMELFSQNHIKGKVYSRQQEMLFFSIPFDEGWRIKIDNKEVKSMMVNIGFTGVLLDKGDHQVELTFIPRFYNIGKLGSLAGLILFLLIVSRKYLFTRKRNMKETPVSDDKGSIAE